MFKNKYFNLLWLMRNERHSLDELISIQNIKLRHLIKHAYENVRFYRDIFQEIGLHPEDIKSVDDIHKIPIIDKNDFHQRPYSDLLDKRIKNKERLIPINTSGSSGSQLKFYIDHNYDQFRKAQYLRPYLTNGRRLSDMVVWLRAYDAPKKKWFQRLSLMREHRVYSGLNLDNQIKIIKEMKPAILQGYGSVLALLASKILEYDIPIHTPRIIFTDSELLTEEMRQKIEKVFNAEVIDIYGTYETDNIGYECSKHEGYHIATDCVIMEFIKDGKRARPNEEGEIVCTVLDNFAMPFIRYNLHDIGSYTLKPCSCGRSFLLMDKIAGRSNDYLVHENGLKKSPFTFIRRFKHLSNSMREYQMIQEDINLFKILVVPGHEFNCKTEQNVRENTWKEFPKAQINIKIVKKIDRDKSGKFRAFISNVKDKSASN
ncbi:MAG: phenylacetate--CoA ligase family protein [Candidatus Scalinduaceae bacterium]